MRKTLRFLPSAIAQLEISGALQSHLAHCDRPPAFKQNGSTVKGTRLHVHGEVGLQRMKIQRMINWTAGLRHQFSLMRVIHGHRTRTIIALQKIGGPIPYHLKNGNRINCIFLEVSRVVYHVKARSFTLF